MSLQSRIEALKGRHASLESKIVAEDRRPSPDSTALARMKVEKLRLKEEMERLKAG
ncbi:MAG TPA: YdcH family protein [Acidocella sp.]|nr:YdcH family protein [Acidocella sp.]